MKVFISWSGELSNSIALALKEWLPKVIQAAEPFVSSTDIDKGARWSTDISKELESSHFGILCITRENVEAAWLNFEAGALSKTIEKSRVCPFLFGLKRSEIRTGPLLQFQSTIYEREEVAKLLNSLNESVSPKCIDESRLESIFEVFWPKLKEELDPLLEDKSLLNGPTEKEPASSKNEQNEILEELLDLVRNQHKILNSPEVLLPQDYLLHSLRRLEFGEIHPNAIRDLENCLQRARSLRGLDIESISRNQLIDIIRDLDEPLEYLLRRVTRMPRRPKMID